MTIRLIALDVDGTLLNDAHQVTPRVEAALRQALARGIEIILATGKSLASVERLAADLGLSRAGVYVQGLLIHGRDGRLVEQRHLDDRIAAPVIAHAERHGLSLVAYCAGSTAVARRDPYTDLLVAFDEPPPREVGSLATLLGQAPIAKLIFIGEVARIESLKSELKSWLDGDAAVTSALPGFVEVLPNGVSKGDGVRRLLAHLGVEAAQVMAVGDGENDIEMLALAGIGVAMGNAPESVRSVARYIVATNNEDGLAQAVERYALA